MNIVGVDLVLESDGTKIDEDEVLKLMKYEVLMLLQPGEDWLEPQCEPFTSTKQGSEGSKSGHPESMNVDDHPNWRTSHQHEKTAKCLCKFQIPWEEMFSRHILEACEQGKRDKRLVTHIIHGVVNKMREIDSCYASQSQASKAVTQQIVSRFPLTFQEIDENGAVVGDGTRAVYRKLIDRHKNMNRYLKKHLSIF